MLLIYSVAKHKLILRRLVYLLFAPALVDTIRLVAIDECLKKRLGWLGVARQRV